jgi:membrane associated rhomboid family serine protease
MSTGGPDLFVICKSCGSEVSPYITECPYCGNRLRKRAPKIDRTGRVTERVRRTRRPVAPSLPRLRRGEIPGIRGETRPYLMMALVAASFAGTLLWRAAVFAGSTHAISLWISNGTHLWWRLLVAPFTYTNVGYAFLALGAIALYGWLLERRHGPLVVLALFAAGGIGGAALASALGHYEFGAGGAALAMIAAWALPDLLELRAGREIEGDLIGTAVIAVAVALLPLAGVGATWEAQGLGVLVGLVLGLPLARVGAA